MGIVVGTLSVATPTRMLYVRRCLTWSHSLTACVIVVGAALPSFAPWILAVACYIISAVQVFGFLGVKRVRGFIEFMV